MIIKRHFLAFLEHNRLLFLTISLIFFFFALCIVKKKYIWTLNWNKIFSNFPVNFVFDFSFDLPLLEDFPETYSPQDWLIKLKETKVL